VSWLAAHWLRLYEMRPFTTCTVWTALFTFIASEDQGPSLMAWKWDTVCVCVSAFGLLAPTVCCPLCRQGIYLWNGQMDDKAVSFPDQNRHDAVSRLPWICRNSAGITAGFRDWTGSECCLADLAAALCGVGGRINHWPWI